MLEAKIRERDALIVDVDRSPRLSHTLDRLPQLADQAIRDLRTLLAVEQVDKGKTLLAMLVSEIILHPVDGHLEAEVRGNLQGLLKLQPPTGGPRAGLNTVGSGGRI